jgi:hypothetical protein
MVARGRTVVGVRDAESHGGLYGYRATAIAWTVNTEMLPRSTWLTDSFGARHGSRKRSVSRRIVGGTAKVRDGSALHL